MGSSSAIGWFPSLSCSLSAYVKQKGAANRLSIFLNYLILIWIHMKVCCRPVCVSTCVSLPRERATLRYCRSWSDSSAPETSHSATPHILGQQCHYLPLHTPKQDRIEQHVRSVMSDAHLCTCTNTHRGTSGTEDRRPWRLVILKTDKSTGVSITHPERRELLWPHPVDQRWAEESWSYAWRRQSERRDGRRRGQTEEM